MASVLNFRDSDKAASRVKENSANLRSGMKRLHSEFIQISHTMEETQKTQTLLAESRKRRDHGHRKVSAITCKSGGVIPVSGIYTHEHPHLPAKECILVRGFVVPWCGRCGYTLLFTLVRSVPHIFEIPDFARNQESHKAPAAPQASRRPAAAARS